MADKLFSERECRVLEQVMHHRRDVRGNRFTRDPVSNAVIDRILDAALRAPSVGFSQTRVGLSTSPTQAFFCHRDSLRRVSSASD